MEPASPGRGQAGIGDARFTQATRAGDAATSEPAVKQPETLDSDPLVWLPRAKVAGASVELMNDPEPIDATRRRLRSVLGGPVPARDGPPLGFRRLGPLELHRLGGPWFLTHLYVEG